MLQKGLVQIYTGDGKGKTTAALGLALRAAGHGGKVLIYQFLKPGSLDLGERMTLSKIGGITIKTPAERWDMRHSFQDSETVSRVKAEISEVCRELATAAAENFYDVIILDEIIFCLSKDLAKLEDVKNIIEKREPSVEIVLTGRGATEELIKLADLVTEMKEVKHPLEKGVPARKGIEF